MKCSVYPVLATWVLPLGLFATPMIAESAGTARDSQAPAQAASARAQGLPGIRTERDIPYVPGGHERQKLDIYRAEDAKPTDRRPLIVWIHGGAWKGGSKDGCPAVRFVRRGYVVASVNYRLSQHAVFPAQIHDCKAAIRFLRANADKYGIDPARIGVWGGSAGGHLVALLGTTGGVKELEGAEGGNLDVSSRVQAVCDFFGPTDFPGYFGDDSQRNDTADNAIADLLGGALKDRQELAALASPARHVTADDSPFLICHGDRDPLVPLDQSRLLHTRLLAAGVDSTLHVVPGAGHGFGGREIEKLVDEFFDRYLNGPPAAVEEGTRSVLADGTTLVRDIPYVPGGHERQKLDVYLPSSQTDKPRPLVVWVHGGAWLAGSKEQCPARSFLKHGYVVASINYRLSQHAIFPAQIEDCKAAIRFLRAHADRYGIDPERIGVWGASAGGHLVALLGTTGDVEDFDTEPNRHVSSRVQAVCDFFGPTDLTQMSAFPSQMDHDAPDAPEARLIGGPVQENKDACRRANPITYVSREDPPFLICHGDKDPLVPHNQSELLEKALRDKGVSVTLHTVKGGGHGWRDAEVDRLVQEFFDRHLKRP